MRQLRDRGDRPGLHQVFLQGRIRCVDFRKRHVIAPEIGKVLQDMPRIRFVQLGPSDDTMLQHQAAIAGEIDVDHLDVRIEEADVMLPRQLARTRR